jgi:hypothetical protein
MRYVFSGLAFLSMGIGLLLITKVIFGIILIIFSVGVISIGIIECIKYKKNNRKIGRI